MGLRRPTLKRPAPGKVRNALGDRRTLVAVTNNVNRFQGDQDIAEPPSAPAAVHPFTH